MCVCAQCPHQPEEAAGLPVTGAAYSSELPRGCWETKPGPLEEWPCFKSLNHLSTWFEKQGSLWQILQCFGSQYSHELTVKITVKFKCCLGIGMLSKIF